ncbi:MAG: hypothetical protein Q4F88_05175 [Eubacteriales bacterium]|nr:hypothetical protein [Eubacteriales bacterium]
MNDEVSKKLIIIKIGVISISIIFLTLSIILIVKCNIFDFLLNEKKYVRDIVYNPKAIESIVKR